MSMIYFLKHFMKYQNSENRFSEFSLSWKTFLLNLFSCLINSFTVNDVCKNLKENVNIKVKVLSPDELILMQLQGFKCIKHRGGIETSTGGLL